MPFQRVWDSSCPQEYDRWEADGATWVIQDLRPEDDEEALKLLVEHLLPDEVLCAHSGVKDDPVSLRSMSDYWRISLAQRMSLACYVIIGGRNTLVALNCCIVQCANEKDEICEIEGKAWKNVYDALKYLDSKQDSFQYLGLDKLLYAVGLVVKREYRGFKLGSRVLAAREPLALSQGIKGTSTVFTGPASQKSAARAGFETAYEVTLRELAESGLDYPRDGRIVKLMVKKYVDEERRGHV